MTAPRASIPLLVAISLVWGSSWVANNMLSGVAGPLHLAVLRYGAAFLLLTIAAGFSAIVGRNAPRPAARPSAKPDPALTSSLDEAGSVPEFAILRALEVPGGRRYRWYGRCLLLGCTMFALPELFVVPAAEHGAAAFIPLVYAVLPLGLSIAAGALRVPAILAVGAMLVLLNGSLSFTVPKLAWALLIALAVALQGWSLLYARAHLADVASLRGCMAQATGAFSVLIVALPVWPEPGGALPLRAWPAPASAALCALAGLGIAVAYPLYYRLLAHLEPAQLAVSTWLQTLVAVGESAALLRQRPGWPMLCAAAALLACTAALLQTTPHKATGLRLLPGEGT